MQTYFNNLLLRLFEFYKGLVKDWVSKREEEIIVDWRRADQSREILRDPLPFLPRTRYLLGANISRMPNDPARQRLATRCGQNGQVVIDACSTVRPPPTQGALLTRAFMSA